GFVEGEPVLFETTLGRALFNETLPADFPFVQEVTTKSVISQVVNTLAERYTKTDVATTLDTIKDAGVHWATRSGISVALSDVITPPEKAAIVAEAEQAAAKIQSQYDKGLLSDAERRQDLTELWTKATNDVQVATQNAFDEENSIYRMVTAGANGNWI